MAQMKEFDRLKHGFFGTVGNTPLIKFETVPINPNRLEKISQLTGCNILAKAEYLNPGGSVKDRADGLERGLIKPGGLITEGTAGNTGIGLVYAANAMGLKSLFVCPEYVSTEKINILETLGAKVELVPGAAFDSPNHFTKVAQRRAEELGGYYVNQFFNEANPRAHYETTGPEIWEQTGGKLDAVVSVCGSGGTIGGVTKFLKEKDSKIQVWMIDPPGTGIKMVKNEEDNTLRVILKDPEEKKKEGIGTASLYYPLTDIKLDGSFIGEDKIALETMFFVLKEEGFFVGPTSGLNVLGAIWMAKLLGPGHTIVTIFCDSGNNYQSKVANEEYLKSKNLYPLEHNNWEKIWGSFNEARIRIKL